MKFKKAISLFLAASAVSAAAAGLSSCGSSTSIDYDAIMAIEDPENYVYEENITIRIPVYDRAQTGQADVADNYWTQYVQENFGDKHNITVEFIAISRTDEVTKINQLMAGKKSRQPDIIFHYDYPQIITYAKSGMFQTLDDAMIQKFAPTYYEATKDLDQYTYVNGEKTFLAATRPRAYNSITVIRADWLRENGYDVPEDIVNWTVTEDEYYDMLKSFNDNKNGGPNTVAMELSLPNANFGNYAYRNYPISAHDWALYSDLSVCSLPWEPTYDQIKYNNNLVQMGLASPEWYLDTDGSTAKSNFSAGIQGTHWFYLTKDSAEINALLQNDADAELQLTPLIESDGEVKGSRSDNPFGLMTGINVNCEHPEAVLMYFEWMQNNLQVMQSGIEGLTYEMQDVGDGQEIPVLIDGYAGEERLNYNANKDMWCIVTEGRDYGDDELNAKAQVYTYAPDGFEYLIEDSYNRIKDTDHLNYIDFLFDRSIDSLADKSSTLLEIWQRAATELYNCDPSEFDSIYEKYCTEYLNSGYQEVLDEKETAYQDMKANDNLPDPLPEGIISDDEAAELYGGDGNQPLLYGTLSSAAE
ncbi:MAG: extracellular solute-binding protein [Firmicutes bacterium]|nr:extracellular solute-binding protein [Bacillota bacterium]